MMLMLLAEFEFDGWFHFFKNKELSKKIGLPLKPNDVIVMSSNVTQHKQMRQMLAKAILN